jgi:hypothetical protein
LASYLEVVIRLLVILACACVAHASDFSSKFAVVMIDDATEAKLGPFPYDRSVMAKAVEACAEKGAKAVALKFFFDLPKSAEGDKALQRAMTKIPVLLQARLEPNSGTPQLLPVKFSVGRELPTAIRGDRGWIPLPMLLENAAACGFVDFESPNIPMVETYQGKTFKSFVVCCLEAALDKPASFSLRQVAFGNRVLAVDDRNVFHAQFKEAHDWKACSLVQLLEGNVEAEEMNGRVVIIGWDTARTNTIGKVRIHVYYIQALAAAYDALRVVR